MKGTGLFSRIVGALRGSSKNAKPASRAAVAALATAIPGDPVGYYAAPTQHQRWGRSHKYRAWRENDYQCKEKAKARRRAHNKMARKSRQEQRRHAA